MYLVFHLFFQNLNLKIFQISPYILFIARDHYYDDEYFNSIKENDNILAKVIGHRYDLYDTNISIIAELVKPKRGINKKN